MSDILRAWNLHRNERGLKRGIFGSTDYSGGYYSCLIYPLKEMNEYDRRCTSHDLRDDSHPTLLTRIKVLKNCSTIGIQNG